MLSNSGIVKVQFERLVYIGVKVRYIGLYDKGHDTEKDLKAG